MKGKTLGTSSSGPEQAGHSDTATAQHRVRACRLHTLLVAALATAAVLALGVSPANAALSVAGTFGGPGTGNGEFQGTGGLALASNGDVYVMDVGGNRIERFSASGTYLSQFGSAGSGNGEFSFGAGTQLAVDPGDGSVYVADAGKNRIQKFDSSGAYVTQFGTAGSGDGDLSDPRGVAVDPTTGDVYVADTRNHRVQRFDSSGVYISQFGSEGAGDGQFMFPWRLAVDSTGRVYVIDLVNLRVQRFSSTGAFDSVFAASAITSPSELALDPTDDHVFVGQFTPDFSEQEVFEFDTAGTLVDIHLSGNGGGVSMSGLTLNPASGIAYVSDGNNNRVLILDEVAPPIATIGSVTDVAPHSATFNGEVDPNGVETNYHFEYSTDGSSWTPVGGDVSVGAGNTAVPVTQNATGLAANTPYQVRLVASHPLGAGTDVSESAEFTTATTPPLVEGLHAGARTDTEAALGARINPENSPTTYFVEYSANEDLSASQRVPVAPDGADGGSGGDFAVVSQLISGLQPATTYYFRVVAENVAGPTTGATLSFATQAALPSPPPGRAYEMVSPLDKNGGSIERGFVNPYGTSGAAASGDAVAYSSRNQFGEEETGALFPTYRSVRGPDGWRTEGITPRHINSLFGTTLPRVDYLSEDLSKAVVATDAPLADNASSLNGSWGLYLRNNDSAVERYQLLSNPSPLLSLPKDESSSFFEPFDFGGATPDMSHVVFTSRRQLLPEGPADSGLNPNAVYEWVDGELKLASVMPTGVPAPAKVFAGGAVTSGAINYPGDHLISDDGERIFFTGENSSTLSLFVRENGASTTAIGQGVFQAARASDGSVVFFLSPFITNSDLLRWDANAAPGDQVTSLTGNSQSVLGTVGFSDDATRAYFVASGVLADGARAGEPNLYLWQQGAGITYITTVDNADSTLWNVGRGTQDARTARVSADGRRLLFASSARLTSYDNAGHRQLYLYDADRDELRCVSCNPRLSASINSAQLFDLPPARKIPYRLPRNLSADGRQVFFETPERLVAADTNAKTDVYEWVDDALDMDGQLRLISSGTGGTESVFVDASKTGDDVFFTTRDRLVGIDTDDQVDLYDARVGGGIAAQNPSPPPLDCSGDGCQSVPPASPPNQNPTSNSFLGEGNQRDGAKAKRCGKGQRKVRRNGKIRCVKKGRHPKSAKRANHNRRAGR